MGINSLIKDVERKFLLDAMPSSLANLPSIFYERYYLFANDHTELRIQKKETKGGPEEYLLSNNMASATTIYELEHKIQTSKSFLQRESIKINISKSEWEDLRAKAEGQVVILKKYRLPQSGMSIKQYQGRLEGLVLLEVGFKTVTEATDFQAEEWMEQDVSSTKFSRDSGLVHYPSFKELKEEFPETFHTSDTSH